MKIGIIIGRFQLHAPHEGHKALFKEVAKRSDRIFILVGESPVLLTDKNPLSFEMRVSSIWKAFGAIPLVKLMDHPSDEIWSNNVDEAIENCLNEDTFIVNGDVTLYGSRDSFIPHYHGKHKTVLLDIKSSESSTQIRKEIIEECFTSLKGSTDFKLGIFYATQKKFPVAYPTVDIAILKRIDKECIRNGLRFPAKPDYEILMGSENKIELRPSINYD